jgi:LysM repeat protein
MMKVDEFLSKMHLAASVKSLYVKGAFGAPANETNKKRYCVNNPYNKRADRTAKIMAAAPDVFFSDCCGIIKGVLWGWRADVNKRYGGAEYKANGVPDVGADGMIQACKDASKDFSRIEPGMLVWLSGHVGIYVGDGLVVESTPAFKDGCQYTNLGNLGYKTGNWRNWTKCGHLPWVEYKSSSNTEKPQTEAPAQSQTYIVKKGDSLSKIGKQFGVPWKSIADLNGISFPYIIRVGQKIKIK